MCVPLFLWLENDEAGERVKNFFVTLECRKMQFNVKICNYFGKPPPKAGADHFSRGEVSKAWRTWSAARPDGAAGALP